MTHTFMSSSARQVVSLSTVDDSLNEHANHRHALERGDLLLIIRFLSLFATRFRRMRFKKLAERKEEQKKLVTIKIVKKAENWIKILTVIYESEKKRRVSTVQYWQL